MFFTRIPVPSLPDFHEDDLAHAARWFPAVGLLVGGIQAALLALAALALPLPAAALLALAAGLMLTGAIAQAPAQASPPAPMRVASGLARDSASSRT